MFFLIQDELTEREMKYLKIFIEDEEMNKGNVSSLSVKIFLHLHCYYFNYLHL